MFVVLSRAPVADLAQLHVAQEAAQSAEPCKLFGPTDRGIASARRRQDEDRRSAKGFCLRTEMTTVAAKKFIDPFAVKGYDPRLGLTKLLE